MRTVGGVVRVLVEFLVLWGSSALALIVLDRILGGITLDQSSFTPLPTLPAALVLALVFGLLNAALWPVMMRCMSWIGPVLLFVGVFLAGGVIMLLTVYLVPVASADQLRDAFFLAALLSLFTSVLSGAIASRSDTAYRLMQVRRQRFRLRRNAALVDASPGLLCIQIDGLGYDVLRRAIADGVTPGLAKLVRETHRLVPWHTDWSSQTGATQLGVLHGSNHNVPAFRWYDKTTERISVFSNPADNEQRELERTDIPGLLAHDGASRGNLFTGGAHDNVLVVSRMRGARLGGGAGYSDYFADPASALRTFIRMFAELQRELRQSLRQKRKDIQPRVPRGGVYPFVRAFATVLATDVAAAAVVGDLIKGRSVVYVDLIGYDEVSHHSGISRPETLAVLTKLDDVIEMLLAVVQQADRPYRVVVLSDHGQSQGATFQQRYGETSGAVGCPACRAARTGCGEAALVRARIRRVPTTRGGGARLRRGQRALADVPARRRTPPLGSRSCSARATSAWSTSRTCPDAPTSTPSRLPTPGCSPGCASIPGSASCSLPPAAGPWCSGPTDRST